MFYIYITNVYAFTLYCSQKHWKKHNALCNINTGILVFLANYFFVLYPFSFPKHFILYVQKKKTF